MDPRYATIALRTSGAAPGVRVRWFVDGREWRDPRWRLTAGRHTLRAVAASGERDEVRVEVR